MKHPIYLDYMATTPVDPSVAEVMWRYLTPTGEFGNPASITHVYGWRAKEAVETAREQVAGLIHAEPNEIIWTSGATESNNLAIKGVTEFFQEKGKHVITCITEHKAVLDPCRYLEKKGYEVTYLPVNSRGLINLEQLQQAIRSDTVLISIMHVNNEIGVIQDIVKVGAIAKQHGILFHVDAAQSVGKIAVDVQQIPVDLMSLASHKVYGPKGIGALYVRRKPRARLTPQIHGGGHELGLRSGTLATHQIAGMGAAFALAQSLMPTESIRLAHLRDLLWQQLAELPSVTINGSLQHCIPGMLNIHVHKTDGESLITALQPTLAISSGSACTSAEVEPSYVLTALGLTGEEAKNSLRICVGRYTTEKDIMTAATCLKEKIQWLRGMSPLW
jgi:cysteine desulfurase